jgi:hypothetical protein
VIEFCIAQQCFGGYTAPVQTDAAQGIALDQRDVHSQLRRAYGGDIPSGSPTYHNQITRMLRLRHASPLPLVLMVVLIHMSDQVF